ncbi:MAG: flagellar hook-basal body complex protein, partial [Selenomonas sp.]|nr:flagellar hook-basal body complex protein [Selenomonas sp.]
MMRSLFSGVAGLKGHQTRMDVIGNNIANVNTTGFKSSRVTFADTLNQTVSGASAPGDTIGGTNPKQIGLGVGVASIDLLFTDGSVQSTGKNTDLCLSGNGLFIVKQGNETYYTRDGAFEFDAAGNYVLPGNGMFVQGWMAKDGVLNTNGAVSGIKVEAGKSMAAAATSKAAYNNNLDASEETVNSMKITDANGNTITIAGDNTDSYTVGNNYTSTITNLNVAFSNGIEITSANGQYTMNTNYALSGDTTVTLADGDTLTVPTTSKQKYKVGSNFPSSNNPIQTLNPTSKTAILADNAVLTNNGGKTYKLKMGNNDVVSVPPTATGTYTVDSALTDTV